NCTILSRNPLSLIAQVWKVEAFLLGTRDHVFKTVFRVSRIIIAVDGNQTGPLGQIVPLQLNHSRLVRLHVGTVIAAKDDCERLLVSETIQRVRLTIHPLQLKIYSNATKRKSN